MGVLAASLAALHNLSRTFVAEQDRRVEQLRRTFADRDLLRNPEQPLVRFAAIEALAGRFRDDPTFTGITVTKFFGPVERVVYPFYAQAVFGRGESEAGALVAEAVPPATFTHPLPWALRPGDRVLDLSAGGARLGRLFVRIDDGAGRAIRMAILGLGALLAGAAGLFALQFRGQRRVITRTVIELEEKRREFTRLERLAMAGRLSAGLLHDLKKPLLNIRAEAEDLAEVMAEKPSDAAAGGAGAAARVRGQVDLFFAMLRESGLERFVKPGAEPEFVDVHEVIERSLALVGYERGSVAVERRFAAGAPPVFAEPARLIQVFSNLALNAYQAMEGRGTLTVSTRVEDGTVAVDFADDGPGMDATAAKRVFQPFFTTKADGAGTGLGLYIAKDIVTELGGTIAVRAGSPGTVFTVKLPAK